MPVQYVLVRPIFALLLVLLVGSVSTAHGQARVEQAEAGASASDTTSSTTVVLGPEQIRRAVATSSVEALRATAGVNVARTGLDRREVALRGSAGVLSEGPLVLVDDRPAALPALGVNVFALMPIQQVDLKRVEIDRGPAAARYGPEAHAGVIHFVTKDPFDDPGTTVAVSGGSRPYVSGEFRHAGDVGGTFGYDVTGYLARGNDWLLDPGDTVDRPWLSYDYVFTDPATAADNQHVDPETGRLLRDSEYQKVGIHGRLAYRLANRTTIAAQGGYASLTALALSEVGALQTDYLGYSFGQLQLRSDDFFAQFALNNNEAGDSYIYGTAQSIVDRGVQYNAQVRHRFERPIWQTDVTLGAAANWIRPRTNGTLMGRNEERDAINAYGAYANSRTALSTRLDLALGLRADIDNLDERVWLAPHVAFTYDLTPAHAVHVRYDRAAARPQPGEYFLDAPVHRRALFGPFRITHHARGAGEGFTFDAFRRHGETVSLIPDIESFGKSIAAHGVPLAPVYRSAAEQFDRLLTEAGAEFGPIGQRSTAQIDRLAEALQDLAAEISGQAVTHGELGVPRGGGGYTPVEAPGDVAPLARPITRAVELGYRGTLRPRLQLAVDAYYVQTKNAIGPLQVVAPMVYVPALAQDVRTALEPIIAQRATDPDASLGSLLEAMDWTPAEAAQIAAALVDRAFADTPVAVVQPDQMPLPSEAPRAEVGTLLTYRNVDRIEYLGVDVNMHVQLREGIATFGAVSLVSDDLFSVHSTGDTAARRSFARNAPAFRAYLGVDLTASEAWAMHAAGRYAARFPVRAGLYEGTVPAAYPIDVGLRYDARQYVSGLRMELTVRNVFNQAHREFVGAPALGRMALARISYAL